MKTILALLVTLLAMPAWGDAGEDWGKTRGWGYSGATEPYDCTASVKGHLWFNTTHDLQTTCDGTEWRHPAPAGGVSVYDYGAACDFEENVSPATLTDDSAAIQAAIDAVAADREDPMETVFFPAQCYVESKIFLKNYMTVQGTGNSISGSGIFCAEGMNDHCTESSVTAAIDWHGFQMRDMQVIKVRSCPTTETTCVGNGPCSCDPSDDTIGHGLHMVDYPGEAWGMTNVSFRGFPWFGINNNVGVGGNVKYDRLRLFGNGTMPPITGTVTSHTTTTLVDSTAPFGADDTKIGWFVRTSDGNTRRVSDSTSTTLTVAPWAVEPTDSVTTYSLDYGGGMLIEAGATGLHHLNITSAKGDGNIPALFVVSGGSGGYDVGGGGGVEFRSIGSESGGGNQENAIRFIANGNPVYISGVSHFGASDGAALYWEGNAAPTHVEYHNINNREEASPGAYKMIDTTGLDTVTDRIIVGSDNDPDTFSHHGFLPYDMEFDPLLDPPFACSDRWQGNVYNDLEIGQDCVCIGGADDTWRPVSNLAGDDCDT